MSDPPRKTPTIPAWQQNQSTESENPATDHPHASDPATQLSHAELLEQAREFLKDDSIRNASRERKVAFLQGKGIQESDVEQLLNEESTKDAEANKDELKTVHDSNESPKLTPEEELKAPEGPKEQQTTKEAHQESTQPSQRDLPPIITYPEFLLKPQKPPPLITIDRLINAAYAFVGISTLTYGASKFIIEPMIENLTEARHTLATTTIADLEKLNHQLESNVSHVPYIAATGGLRRSQDQEYADDGESITSDPTELFHRDIATQTTPSLSRTPSHDSSKEHLDATTQQVVRLSSLHETLTSLVSSIDPKPVPYLPAPANKKLHDTISDFQGVLDKLETTYSPLRGDYYSTLYAQPADKSKGGKDSDIVAKVRTEIRNLKGAFLSARNFPTAPRPANPYSSR